jgi:hypothetical protein
MATLPNAQVLRSSLRDQNGVRVGSVQELFSLLDPLLPKQGASPKQAAVSSRMIEEAKFALAAISREVASRVQS